MPASTGMSRWRSEEAERRQSGIAASFETLCTPVRAVSDAESDGLLEALR